MRMTPSLKLAALGLLTLTISACVYAPPRYQASATYAVSGGYYEPWGYYYYPDVQVYFHVSTGDYFYLSGRTWIRTRVLPAYIHLDSRDRVKLHIENERPYLFHHQHVERYRPRPNYRPTPRQDRREREENRRWYQEQQHYKSQRRYAPPAVQTRPSPAPRERYVPAPRYESRQPVPSQPRIQTFEAPLLQPSRPRQVSPQDRNRTRNTEQEQQRRIERQRQNPSSPGGTDSQRMHTVPATPGNGNSKKSGHATKPQKSRQSKQAEQYEERGVQQGDEPRRGKKSRREQEEEQQRYQRRY